MASEIEGQPGAAPEVVFTTNREESLGNERLGLLGLDHRLVESYIGQYRGLPPGEVGIHVESPDGRTGVLSIWQVTSQGERGESRTHILPLAIGVDGQRIPVWERTAHQLFRAAPASKKTDSPSDLLIAAVDAMLQRELRHRHIISDQRGYEAKLIGWIEAVGHNGSRDAGAWNYDILQAVADRTAKLEREPMDRDRKTADPDSPANPDDLGLGGDVRSMRALSIRQPFAEAILRGAKTSEFRSGPTAIRERILIYAGLKRYTDDDERQIADEFDMADVDLDNLPRGVIVGSVELYDCDGGEWFLRNPQRAVHPVPPTNRPNPVWFYPF